MKKFKMRTLAVLLLLISSLFGYGCALEVNFDYNVRFIVDGVQVAEAGTNGKYISMPKNPTKTDYVFDGWYWDEGIWKEPFSVSSLLDRPLEEKNDFKVYAKWKGAKISVTFNSNGGTVTDAVNYTFNEPFGTLPKPAKEGFAFLGWYTQSGAEVKASTVFSDKSMSVLYARWGDKNVTVTFHSDGGSAVASKVYVCDEYMGTLPDTTKKGYNFYGWYSEDGTRVSEYTRFEYALKDLYARWTPISFRANFYLSENSYSAIKYTDAAYGEKYDLPDDPKQEHQTFAGWYIEGTNERITKDSLCHFEGTEYDTIRIVARWENIKYKVKFIVNDALFAEIDQEYGIKMAFPQSVPVKDGYEFMGWRDENGKRIWTDEYYDGNIKTAYADWYALYYNVTYIGYDGAQLRTAREDFGSYYSLFEPPVLSGYEFEGWYTQPDGKGDRIDEFSKVSVAADHNIYAHYVPAEVTVSEGVFTVTARVEDAKYNWENELIITCEYFAPDGETYGGDYNIIVYGKNLVRKYTAWTGKIKPSFDTQGDILAVADGKEYVTLFNVTDGIETGRLTGESGNCYASVAIDADTVIFANNNHIVFHNTGVNTRIVTQSDIGNPLLVTNRDANILYVTSYGYSPGAVAYFNTRTGEKTYRSAHTDFGQAWVPVRYDGSHVWYDEYNPVMLDAFTAEVLPSLDLSGYAGEETNKRVCADTSGYIIVESTVIGSTHDDETSVKNYRYYDKLTGDVVKTITVKVSSNCCVYGNALIIYNSSSLSVWYLF